MSDSCLLPQFDSAEVAAIAQRLFALNGAIKQLDGERDLNFLISEADARFVFKIANAEESPAMLECQHQVFQQLAEAQVFPRVATAVESVNGRLIETVSDARGNNHYCRVLPFLEGRMLADLPELAPQLLTDLGHRLALLDKALTSFSHPGLKRPLLWHMPDALTILEKYKPLLANSGQRMLVETFENGYRERLLPRQHDLRHAVIHNDANRANVLVDEAGLEVVSIIDFGDMMNSWLIVEPAIAATYVMLDQADPLGMAGDLLRGYHQTLPLTTTEISQVYDLIGMRLCMSVCINAYQTRLNPDNEYLNTDIEAAWNLLSKLHDINHADARDALLAACHYY
ncbi:MAG: phosphotransferase [Gammaproteobacteria bacterium]|nr:phosphotransferase [Gammaproteobacteria bacterium]